MSDRRMAGRSLAELDLIRTYGVTVTRVPGAATTSLLAQGTPIATRRPCRVVGPIADRYCRSACSAIRSGASLRSTRSASPSALPRGSSSARSRVLGVARLTLGPWRRTVDRRTRPRPLTRTGRVTWQIGHGANAVLRQLGILMFLACAGLASGTAFVRCGGYTPRARARCRWAGRVADVCQAIPLATELVLRRATCSSRLACSPGRDRTGGAGVHLRAHGGATIGSTRPTRCVSGGDDRQDHLRAVPGLMPGKQEGHGANVATWSTTRCERMLARTHTLPPASPPTAVRLAMSSRGRGVDQRADQRRAARPDGDEAQRRAVDRDDVEHGNTVDVDRQLGVGRLPVPPVREAGVEQAGRRGGAIGEASGAGPEPAGHVDTICECRRT